MTILKRVAVLGSAFNPPHLGHKDILEQIYRDYDEILLVPSYRHAFGKQMIPYCHRLSMASMMAQAFHNEAFNYYQYHTPILISDIERRLGRSHSEPVYTYDVLHALEADYCKAQLGCELTFIIGPDNAQFETWKKFYRGSEIVERWKLRSVSERVAVHSTEIRDLINDYPRPASLFAARFSHYLDNLVANYIFQNQLYGVHV